jgi:hypothetical protein
VTDGGTPPSLPPYQAAISPADNIEPLSSSSSPTDDHYFANLTCKRILPFSFFSSSSFLTHGNGAFFQLPVGFSDGYLAPTFF